MGGLVLGRHLLSDPRIPADWQHLGMTLVLSLHSRDMMWLLTDRRLSYDKRRRPVDDAIKVMELGTLDGIALLGYAGLGATSAGTHPSAWMSAVLRGRAGLTLEQALGILTDVAARELPPHLAQLPRDRQAHFIVAPAFISGVGARLFAIDNAINPLTGQPHYRYLRWVRDAEAPDSPSARIGLAGTGGSFLSRLRTPWMRRLLDLAKRHDRGQVSAEAVADQLAGLNFETHTALTERGDNTVGPRCIVAWRGHLDGPRAGGAHACYTGTLRDASIEAFPAINSGVDVGAIIDAMLAAGLDSQTPDLAELDRLIALRDWDPDEKLR